MDIGGGEDDDMGDLYGDLAEEAEKTESREATRDTVRYVCTYIYALGSSPGHLTYLPTYTDASRP